MRYEEKLMLDKSERFGKAQVARLLAHGLELLGGAAAGGFVVGRRQNATAATAATGVAARCSYVCVIRNTFREAVI